MYIRNCHTWKVDLLKKMDIYFQPFTCCFNSKRNRFDICGKQADGKTVLVHVYGYNQYFYVAKQLFDSSRIGITCGDRLMTVLNAKIRSIDKHNKWFISSVTIDQKASIFGFHGK